MKTQKLLSICICLLPACQAWGQDSLGIAHIWRSEQYWAPPRRVVVHDSLAMVATDETGVKIIALEGQNNDQMREIGSIAGDARDIARLDSFLISVDKWSTIRVYDWSPEPQLITEIIQEDSLGDTGLRPQLAVFENRLALCSPGAREGNREISIYDLSEVNEPRRLGDLDLGNTEFVQLLHFDSSILVLHNYNRGIEFYDISEPEDISFLGVFETQNYIQSAILRNNYLYLNDGWGLVTLDIEDPSEPQQVGETLLGPIGALAILDNTIFSFGHFAYDPVYDFDAIDIEDPEAPEHLIQTALELSGGYPVDNDYITIHDGSAYLTTEGSIICLRIDDIGEIEELISRRRYTNLTRVRHYLGSTIFQNHIYSLEMRYTNVNGTFGLFIYNPAVGLQQLGSTWCESGEFVEYGMAIQNRHCYVISLDDYRRDDLLSVINVENVARPVPLRILGAYRNGLGGDPFGVTADDRWLYVARRDRNGAHIDIVETSRPDSLIIRGIIALDGLKDIDSHNNHLIVLEGDHLIIFMVEDPEEPEEISSTERVNARSMFLDGDICRIIHTDGVTSINISDPANPEVIGESNAQFNAEEGIANHSIGVRQFFSREFFDWTNELALWNFEEPNQIIQTGSHDLEFFRNRIFPRKFVFENLAFITSRHWIDIFDISAALGEPVPPVFRDPPGEIFARETDTVRFDLLAVDLNGDSLVITMRDNGGLDGLGAQFADHRDGTARFYWPTNYDHAGNYQPVFSVSDGEAVEECTVEITISNLNRLPVAFALSSPPDYSPVPEDSTVDFTWNRSSDLDGEDLAYLFKVSGPDDYLFYNTRADTSHPQPRRDLLYLLGDTASTLSWEVSATDGIDTIRCDSVFTLLPPLDADDSSISPFTFHLSPPYPNPFNSSTTISFSLPGFGEAGLRVYDLQGRLVKDLVRGRFEAGEHKVVWEAKGLGSGVYLVRLSAGIRTQTSKIVLVR